MSNLLLLLFGMREAVTGPNPNSEVGVTNCSCFCNRNCDNLCNIVGGKPLMAITFLLIHSFILETYIAYLQETTTQRRSQLSHGLKRRASERCKIWKGGPSEGTAAQMGHVSDSEHVTVFLNRVFL